MAGRISRLSDPGFAKAVAEAYTDGLKRAEMAELFGCHEDTMSDWVRDPRVQAHAMRLVQERVGRITRKLDSEIDRRILDVDDEDKYPMELILKMRKELLDRAIRFDFGNGKNEAQLTSDAISAAEEDPDFAREMIAWATGQDAADKEN